MSAIQNAINATSKAQFETIRALVQKYNLPEEEAYALASKVYSEIMEEEMEKMKK